MKKLTSLSLIVFAIFQTEKKKQGNKPYVLCCKSELSSAKLLAGI